MIKECLPTDICECEDTSESSGTPPQQLSIPVFLLCTGAPVSPCDCSQFFCTVSDPVHDSFAL